MLLDSPPKVFHVKSDNCEWSKIQLKIYFKSHKQCLSTCLIKKTRTEIVMSWYTKNLKNFFYFKWIISTPRYLTNFILFWVSLTWRKHQVKQQHGGRQKLIHTSIWLKLALGQLVIEFTSHLNLLLPPPCDL